MGQTYKEMLQSPLWQKKRLEVFNQKGFRCEECGDEESQLAVHHKYYKKDFKPWDYQDDAYMVLCTPCHDAVHKAKKIVLTPKEAKIIMIIREKLHEVDYYALHDTLNLYAKDNSKLFFYLLPYLICNTLILEPVRQFIHQAQQIKVHCNKIKELKDELSKYKTD